MILFELLECVVDRYTCGILSESSAGIRLHYQKLFYFMLTLIHYFYSEEYEKDNCILLCKLF